ncbi:TrkA family potassium uptake protein [uncultured Tateyamaria sp.]|uniref:potassium channel family protein n=1 Tax=uncultured Tateyamaria sp. TaxID=455651 RepID=UPI00261D6468|nr:NAD-binding protein [uncultured Tateyamaria sp.]
MRIVIVGGSKFGVATAEQMIDKGHEVVLIDKDRAKLEWISDTLDCGLIEGDGSSPSVLREAFGSEDDVLIALTNASDDNILTALVARSVGFGRVIPQIISPELLEVCAELELDDTITPHATVARSLCRALEEDTEVTEDLNLSGALRLKRVEVPEGLEGKTLADLNIPDTARPVAFIDDSGEALADADTTLTAGAHVLFVVAADDVSPLQKCFSD